MNKAVIFAGGMGIGAGLAYALDPLQGRRRRKLAGDKLLHSVYVGEGAADATARDMRNRVQGMGARLRSRLRNQDVDDEVLVERVRAKLGRFATHPRSIEVSVEHGHVTLRGDILAHETKQVCDAIRSVRGVRGLDNQLTEHGRSNDIPGLQGTSERPGERLDVLQEHWAPSTRAIAGGAGLALTAFGAARRNWVGVPLAVAGLGLLLRAGTNREFKRLLGVGAGRNAVEFHKTMHVQAPVDEVYRFWANIENFPQFMEHVKSVHMLDGQRSHWTVAGPAGMPLSFDTEVTSAVDGHVLAWKSIGRTPIRHAGIVRFDDDERGGTRLDIKMTYNPPFGAAGHVVASLFGADPRHSLNEDMVRFKSLIEEGKTRAHGHEVSRDELPLRQHEHPGEA